VKQGCLTVTKEDSVMTDPTIHAFDDDRCPVTSLDGGDAQPAAGSWPVQVFAATELMSGGVQDTGEHRGADQRAVGERKRPRRSRRAFGSVERLPSGRFRAR